MAAFWLSVGLFIAFSSLIQQTVIYPKAESFDPSPTSVKISNLSSQGFTVSWLTPTATTGLVLLSESRSQAENLTGQLLSFPDDRGLTTSATTHFVTLMKLTPAKKYYFILKSGQTVFYQTLTGQWLKAGLAEEQKTLVTTGEEKNLPPNLVRGQVLQSNGQKATNTLVYLDIPGKSNLLSTLTDNEGQWSINLNNLVKSDLTGFLAYDYKTDLMRLNAESGDNATASIYQTIINPTGGQNYSLNLQLNPPLSPSPTPTAYTIIPTAAPTATGIPLSLPALSLPKVLTSFFLGTGVIILIFILVIL